MIGRWGRLRLSTKGEVLSKLASLIFKIPKEYEKPAINEIFRAIFTQTDSLSEGRIAARYQAQSSVPNGSVVAYTKGDIVWDSNPTVRGSVAPGLAASYVRVGWICTADGSPGTFQEMRLLTGA